MTSDTLRKTRTAQLLLECRNQSDLFIIDASDTVPKNMIPEMEPPFYSLTKQPETTPRTYRHGDNWLTISPNATGLPTIYDRDILIFVISMIVDKKNRGEPVSRRIRFNCHQFLRFANRGTSGKDYDAFYSALERLAGVRISTNKSTGDVNEYNVFGLIDSATVRRTNGPDGRLQWIEIRISEWMWRAIEVHEVLTLHPDYFRLRRPIERRVYELARKYCGWQTRWKCSMEILHRKSGSRSTLRKFRFSMNEIAENSEFPDYDVHILKDEDAILFTNRNAVFSENVMENE